MGRRVMFVVLLAVVMLPLGVRAQYDKYYFLGVGQNFLIDNQYENAIINFNTLLKVDPKAYEGYYLRGVAKYNLNDLLGAEEDFSRAIELNPVYTNAFYARAVMRALLGNYEDALGDYREALDLRPDLPAPYFSRGVTYLASKQYRKAIDDFDHFIRYENKVADAYLNRGTAYLMLKDTTRAYDDFEQAVRTNRESPAGYTRRGMLYMDQKRYPEALTDFDKAISCDSAYIQAYFARAIVYSNTSKPTRSLADFDKVIKLDSTNSQAYFNRAIMRTQIGDYNRALDDYDAVARYSPGNVLVYFNRAMLYTRLGDLQKAIGDYDKAIQLYPDFAAAYLNRSQLRYYTRDVKGSKEDQKIAERKIAEYRARLKDSTFVSYADTSRKLNQLLAFDDDRRGDQDRIMASSRNAKLQPLFKFTLLKTDSVQGIDPQRYYLPRVEAFIAEAGIPRLRLSNRMSDIPADSLVALGKRLADYRGEDENDWHKLFEQGVVLSLIRQYTSSLAALTQAIDRNPSNPLLYLNRSTVRSEMIDFISSIDNSYQRITVSDDPAGLKGGTTTRTYNYDEAIADLNKAAKLYPEMAYIYYNRANLLVLSGKLPEAFEDYSEAIRLNASFAEAFYNRGLVQIFLKDIRKGCLDLSKAGELGIKEAYTILKQYSE